MTLMVFNNTLFSGNFYSRLRNWCYELSSFFDVLLLVRPCRHWKKQLCSAPQGCHLRGDLRTR